MAQIKKSVLVIYFHPFHDDAATINEHIKCFGKYSKNSIYYCNTLTGFPSGLRKIKFDVIVLHYSLFGGSKISISKKYRQYISESQAVKIAFFQDEYYYCKERFRAINEFKIDIIFSLFEPAFHDEVYYRNTTVKRVFHTLTGYVDDELLDKSKLYAKEKSQRTIDVGYRARQLPFYMGAGAQEKTNIAVIFSKMMANSQLKIDITPKEEDRLYGSKWNEFVGNCRFMLGVEAGVSVVDLDGTIREKVERYLKERPTSTFDDVGKAILAPHENNIYYRTISPRMFEAAAFKTGMILFEGKYNGILKPDIHYIQLKKDFSNFNDVLSKIADANEADLIIERAYNDLIVSGKYHYKTFVMQFDELLDELVPEPTLIENQDQEIERIMNNGLFARKSYAYLRYGRYPGRDLIKKIVRKLGIIRF